MLTNAGSHVRAPIRFPPSDEAWPGLNKRLARVVAAMLLLAMPPLPALGAEEVPTRVAVLEIELLKADYLPDADRVTPEERRRLDMVAEMVRERLRGEGFVAVPAAETRAAIVDADPGQYLHACNGCERAIARSLDADWVAVGWIQFVSYLILNLNVLVIDVEEGSLVGRAFVDLRGNTERSWRRATAFLLDNILMEQLRVRS